VTNRVSGINGVAEEEELALVAATTSGGGFGTGAAGLRSQATTDKTTATPRLKRECMVETLQEFAKTSNDVFQERAKRWGKFCGRRLRNTWAIAGMSVWLRD
jgi:hydroxymethylglutaryl-CoA reductase